MDTEPFDHTQTHDVIVNDHNNDQSTNNLSTAEERSDNVQTVRQSAEGPKIVNGLINNNNMVYGTLASEDAEEDQKLCWDCYMGSLDKECVHTRAPRVTFSDTVKTNKQMTQDNVLYVTTQDLEYVFGPDFREQLSASAIDNFLIDVVSTMTLDPSTSGLSYPRQMRAIMRRPGLAMPEGVITKRGIWFRQEEDLGRKKSILEPSETHCTSYSADSESGPDIEPCPNERFQSYVVFIERNHIVTKNAGLKANLQVSDLMTLYARLDTKWCTFSFCELVSAYTKGQPLDLTKDGKFASALEEVFERIMMRSLVAERIRDRASKHQLMMTVLERKVEAIHKTKTSMKHEKKHESKEAQDQDPRKPYEGRNLQKKTRAEISEELDNDARRQLMDFKFLYRFDNRFLSYDWDKFILSVKVDPKPRDTLRDWVKHWGAPIEHTNMTKEGPIYPKTALGGVNQLTERRNVLMKQVTTSKNCKPKNAEFVWSLSLVSPGLSRIQGVFANVNNDLQFKEVVVSVNESVLNIAYEFTESDETNQDLTQVARVGGHTEPVSVVAPGGKPVYGFALVQIQGPVPTPQERQLDRLVHISDLVWTELNDGWRQRLTAYAKRLVGPNDAIYITGHCIYFGQGLLGGSSPQDPLQSSVQESNSNIEASNTPASRLEAKRKAIQEFADKIPVVGGLTRKPIDDLFKIAGDTIEGIEKGSGSPSSIINEIVATAIPGVAGMASQYMNVAKSILGGLQGKCFEYAMKNKEVTVLAAVAKAAALYPPGVSTLGKGPRSPITPLVDGFGDYTFKFGTEVKRVNALEFCTFATPSQVIDQQTSGTPATVLAPQPEPRISFEYANETKTNFGTWLNTIITNLTSPSSTGIEGMMRSVDNATNGLGTGNAMNIKRLNVHPEMGDFRFWFAHSREVIGLNLMTTGTAFSDTAYFAVDNTPQKPITYRPGLTINVSVVQKPTFDAWMSGQIAVPAYAAGIWDAENCPTTNNIVIGVNKSLVNIPEVLADYVISSLPIGVRSWTFTAAEHRLDNNTITANNAELIPHVLSYQEPIPSSGDTYNVLLVAVDAQSTTQVYPLPFGLQWTVAPLNITALLTAENANTDQLKAAKAIGIGFQYPMLRTNELADEAHAFAASLSVWRKPPQFVLPSASSVPTMVVPFANNNSAFTAGDGVVRTNIGSTASGASLAAASTCVLDANMVRIPHVFPIVVYKAQTVFPLMHLYLVNSVVPPESMAAPMWFQSSMSYSNFPQISATAWRYSHLLGMRNLMWMAGEATNFSLLVPSNDLMVKSRNISFQQEILNHFLFMSNMHKGLTIIAQSNTAQTFYNWLALYANPVLFGGNLSLYASRVASVRCLLNEAEYMFIGRWQEYGIARKLRESWDFTSESGAKFSKAPRLQQNTVIGPGSIGFAEQFDLDTREGVEQLNALIGDLQSMSINVTVRYTPQLLTPMMLWDRRAGVASYATSCVLGGLYTVALSQCVTTLPAEAEYFTRYAEFSQTFYVLGNGRGAVARIIAPDTQNAAVTGSARYYQPVWSAIALSYASSAAKMHPKPIHEAKNYDSTNVIVSAEGQGSQLW